MQANQGRAFPSLVRNAAVLIENHRHPTVQPPLASCLGVLTLVADRGCRSRGKQRDLQPGGVDRCEVPAFVLDHSQSSFGDRIINIDILVNHNPKSGKTVEIQDSVTGRNTEFGYPNTVCNAVPAG